MQFIDFYGLAIIIIMMVPNSIYAAKHKETFVNKFDNKTLEIFEQIGRFGSFILMIIDIPLLTLNIWQADSRIIYIVVNAVLLFMYLVGWIVFWKKNNVLKALYLSIIPSIIFLFSGVITADILLLIFAVIFAICHVTISYKNAVLE